MFANEIVTGFTLTDKTKAWLLCLLAIFATSPSLHAQSKCADPYETNCVVTVGPTNCGNLGIFPCWIKYDLTVADNTAGASIHYMIYDNGYEIDLGAVSSGSHIIETENYNPQTYGSSGYGTLSGTIYATASGYSQSNTVNLSF